MNPKRQAILDAAKAEIGTVEEKSNLTKYGKWFGLDGVPWCAIFCCWIYSKTGNPIGAGDFPNGYCSVPHWLQHAKTVKGMVTAEPQPGDLVIYDWQKGKVTETDWTPDHIGIFLGWLDRKAGLFEAIEGNTSPMNQSNGGMVMKRQRNMAFVQAFINPLMLNP